MRDTAYRPETWDSYVGQTALKAELAVAVKAARTEHRPLRAVLLAGGAGLGKTSMANILAVELGARLLSITCPFKESTLRTVVYRYRDTMVFFDEIHRCKDKDQELLLNLIEDNYVMGGNGAKIRARGLSFVAATTEPRKLIGTLVDRFPIRPTFDAYTEEEMGVIAHNIAERAGIDFSVKECRRLGRAAAGVPRNVRNLVVTALDMAVASGRKPSVDEVFKLRRIREDGLTVEHVRYLETLYRQEGKAGLETLSSALNAPPAVITGLETLLGTRGFIKFSPSGRELMPEGYEIIQDMIGEQS